MNQYTPEDFPTYRALEKDEAFEQYYTAQSDENLEDTGYDRWDIDNNGESDNFVREDFLSSFEFKSENGF